MADSFTRSHSVMWRSTTWPPSKPWRHNGQEEFLQWKNYSWLFQRPWDILFYLQRFCSCLDPEWSSSRTVRSNLDTEEEKVVTLLCQTVYLGIICNETVQLVMKKQQSYLRPPLLMDQQRWRGRSGAAGAGDNGRRGIKPVKDRNIEGQTTGLWWQQADTKHDGRETKWFMETVQDRGMKAGQRSGQRLRTSSRNQAPFLILEPWDKHTKKCYYHGRAIKPVCVGDEKDLSVSTCLCPTVGL